VSLSRRRTAQALRQRYDLAGPVVFERDQIDAMLAGRARGLADAIKFCDCEEDRDAVVQWSPKGHSGPGIYVYCGEYPEEGTWFVGPMARHQAVAKVTP
jgi:hypothetical protein